jgi:hypothetical protein
MHLDALKCALVDEIKTHLLGPLRAVPKTFLKPSLKADAELLIRLRHFSSESLQECMAALRRVANGSFVPLPLSGKCTISAQ